jgi:hypothetical protein
MNRPTGSETIRPSRKTVIPRTTVRTTFPWKGEIRIASDLEVTFRGESKAIGHVLGRERGDPLEWKPTLVVAFVEHHIKQGLAAGDSAPGPMEIVAGLHLRRTR